MLPVGNTTYGRSCRIHRLLPPSGLHIGRTRLRRVHINVLALPGAQLSDITEAWSHLVLIAGNAAWFPARPRIKGAFSPDNGPRRRANWRTGATSKAALASELAARFYGLDVWPDHIEGQTDSNTTRFVIMAREPDMTRRGPHMMTTFVFRVRNIPAALYKAMGGFATNGVNMTKLESYMVDGSFTATQFYADIEGHPEDANVRLALEELTYFTSYLEILGTYPAASVRD